MTTEQQMIADQSAYISSSEDQVKIIEAKELLRRCREFVLPHNDPFETDQGFRAYRLREDISRFVDNA